MDFSRGVLGKEYGGQSHPGQGGREGAASCTKRGENLQLSFNIVEVHLKFEVRCQTIIDDNWMIR